MKKLAVFAVLILAACASRPKPNPLYDEIMAWQPRSVRPSIAYTYQPPPMPQTFNVWNPALGMHVPVTVNPYPAFTPSWGVNLNSDGSNDIILNVAPGITVTY